MDYNDLSKVSHYEIMEEMTRLDKEIDILMLKYEKLRLEMIRRFPPLENSEEFKPKTKKL